MVALTHAPTNGGLINPAAAVGELCQQPRSVLCARRLSIVRPGPHRRHGDRLRCAVGHEPQVSARPAEARACCTSAQRALERCEPPFLDLHAATWTTAPRTRSGLTRSASRTGRPTLPPSSASGPLSTTPSTAASRTRGPASRPWPTTPPRTAGDRRRQGARQGGRSRGHRHVHGERSNRRSDQERPGRRRHQHEHLVARYPRHDLPHRHSCEHRSTTTTPMPRSTNSERLEGTRYRRSQHGPTPRRPVARHLPGELPCRRSRSSDWRCRFETTDSRVTVGVVSSCARSSPVEREERSFDVLPRMERTVPIGSIAPSDVAGDHPFQSIDGVVDVARVVVAAEADPHETGHVSLVAATGPCEPRR